MRKEEDENDDDRDHESNTWTVHGGAGELKSLSEGGAAHGPEGGEDESGEVDGSRERVRLQVCEQAGLVDLVVEDKYAGKDSGEPEEEVGEGEAKGGLQAAGQGLRVAGAEGCEEDEGRAA